MEKLWILNVKTKPRFAVYRIHEIKGRWRHKTNYFTCKLLYPSKLNVVGFTSHCHNIGNKGLSCHIGLTFTGRTLLEVYKQHNITFQKSQIADIILSTRFQKIPDDLVYYKDRCVAYTWPVNFNNFHYYWIHRNCLLQDLGSRFI